MERNLVLKVNDKEIPINYFVQQIFMNVIDGMVESLDKIPEDIKTIEIKIKE